MIRAEDYKKVADVDCQWINPDNGSVIVGRIGQSLGSLVDEINNAVEAGLPNAEPNIVDYEAAIQTLVDTTATARRFRDGVTMASYVASTNQQWADEAQAFVAWRDAVWAYAYSELDKVMTGQRPQPTVEDFLAEIEPIDWLSA